MLYSYCLSYTSGSQPVGHGYIFSAFQGTFTFNIKLLKVTVVDVDGHYFSAKACFNSYINYNLLQNTVIYIIFNRVRLQSFRS